MPKIDLCFSGWLRGVEIETAWKLEGTLGKDVDVSSYTSEQLAKALTEGTLSVCLRKILDDADDSNIEIFDFDPN